MNTLEWLNTVIVLLGIPTIIGALIYIGRKLQLLETLKDDVDGKIKPDLQDVRERFATLEGKAANLFASHSPIRLTPSGMTFLKKSGLKDYIDDHTEELLGISNYLRDLQTPYDVQEAVNELFDRYEFPGDVEDKVKNYAFQTGTSMDVARRIAALYFRDICLEAFGFEATE